MLQRIYGEEYMNNFTKDNNMYDPSKIAPLITANTTNTRKPLTLKEFVPPGIHNSNTSPLPAVPPVVHKVTHYPQSWSRSKKLPSLHQISNIILSNREFCIACTVLMSAMFLIYALKLLFAAMMK